MSQTVSTTVRYLEVESATQDVVADGTISAPYPWTDPYKASSLDVNGNETVFVAGVPVQDIVVNGVRYNQGTKYTFEARVAQNFGALIAAPS